MKLLVGLGNPTKEYENTRHNAGFIVLDEIRKEFSFPEFKSSKKFEAEISEGIIKGRNGIKGINGENAGKMIDGKEEEKIILVKPQTFMNLSGKSIELGTFKISTDSSAAGHNGVTSIFETLGTQKIKRIRIGIEGAEKKLERLIPGSDFVLQNFSNEELETVQKLSKEIVKNI